MSFRSALKWSIDIHIFLQAETPPTNESSWRAFNWIIDVGSYYKLKQLHKENASFVHNVDKILSQCNNFQHLSTFSA
jgi:hypothetical protein